MFTFHLTISDTTLEPANNIHCVDRTKARKFDSLLQYTVSRSSSMLFNVHRDRSRDGNTVSRILELIFIFPRYSTANICTSRL